MNYDEKLDQIRNLLENVLAGVGSLITRVEAIEGQFDLEAPPTVPSEHGGLFALVKPATVVPRYGEGKRMTSPDVAEALERARYGVTWAGNVALEGAKFDEVWEEIEKLKTGDPVVTAPYRKLDPEFAGVALLTGLIHLPKYDGLSSVGWNNRNKVWPGWDVARFLEVQLGISGGPSGE